MTEYKVNLIFDKIRKKKHMIISVGVEKVSRQINSRKELPQSY